MDIPSSSESRDIVSEDLDTDDTPSQSSFASSYPDPVEHRLVPSGLQHYHDRSPSIEVIDSETLSESQEGSLSSLDIISDPATLYTDLVGFYGSASGAELYLDSFDEAWPTSGVRRQDAFDSDLDRDLDSDFNSDSNNGSASEDSVPTSESSGSGEDSFIRRSETGFDENYDARGREANWVYEREDEVEEEAVESEVGGVEYIGERSDGYINHDRTTPPFLPSHFARSPSSEVDAAFQLIREAASARRRRDQQRQQQPGLHAPSQLSQLYQRFQQRPDIVATEDTEMDGQQLHQEEPDVIDLTAEPDSPVFQQRPARWMGRQERTRRDDEVQPTVIDLTGLNDDSPDAHTRHENNNRAAGPASPEFVEIRSNRLRRGRPADMFPEMQLSFGLGQFARNRLPPLPDIFPFHRNRHTNQHANHNPHYRNGGRNILRASELENIINHVPQPVDFEIIGQHFIPMNPLSGNQPELNYQVNGILQMPRMGGIGGPEKPPHVPPPPAREGFTRNTGEGVVAVCASCGEELAYDPDGCQDDPPAKRARSRKEREEHHFWAVMACGHVYCRRCFENRRGKDAGLGFASSGKTILCAVDGCQSDVTLKKAWVGLFV